jgi:SAM-dependent methyltransferase
MDTARATSFGAWADEYDEWRPTYPDAAVDWLVPVGPSRVVEVGAGTGKLTDRLVGRGVELDVVEPDGRMLDVIRRRHPGLSTHEAGVADLPLDDTSVDAVLVADAWHWFPKAEAAAEVARVLRPHGWLGCVWNVPVLQHDWEWRALRLDPALQRPADFDTLERLGLHRRRRAAGLPLDVGAHAAAVARVRLDGLARPAAPGGRVPGRAGGDRAAGRAGLYGGGHGDGAPDPRRVVRAVVSRAVAGLPRPVVGGRVR